MNLNIEFLADKPELVPLLAQWTYAQWSKYDPELTVARVTESLEQRFNREKIPLTYVALDGNKPIGMATLKESIRVSGYKNKTPWLGSFYIIPEYRNQGVGSELLAAIYESAKKLGYNTIYLFSSDLDMVPWYSKQGWQQFATDIFHGREIVLMSYNI